MGFVSNLFSGDQGNGYQAQSAGINSPVTSDQANTSYQQNQQALQQQQAFLQALQGQNGIQNQSNVYNQLQGVANGTGPNPAQAMLNQQTGNNIAAQAALMAGQRGTGANAGLLARQAALQGGALQQQAVGQGATMQANQSLNAINSAGNIAGQQVNNQANATSAYTNAAQNEQQNLLNSIAGVNNANVSMQGNQNSNNATIANTNAQAQNKMLGQGIGALGAVAGLAKGGVVKRYADGGEISGPSSNAGQILRNNMSSNMNAGSPEMIPGAQITGEDYLKGTFEAGAPKSPDFFGKQMGGPLAGGAGDAMGGGAGGLMESLGPLAMVANKGGKVPALVSPGEKYLSPEQAKAVAKGKANPMDGKTVPGKAKVKGDSLKNDTVPAKLEEGGVVIPRSVMNSKDPAHEAYKFVQAVMAKSSMKAKK